MIPAKEQKQTKPRRCEVLGKVDTKVSGYSYKHKKKRKAYRHQQNQEKKVNIVVPFLKMAPVEMHVFHISSIVLVPWSSCLGGYSSVPDDYPLVLGCEEHVPSLGVFVA